MTAGSIIDSFDSRVKNSVPESVKLEWLGRLDLSLFNDVWKDREGPERPALPYTRATELLVCEPYADIYLHQLDRERDLMLGDTDRFNNRTVLLRTRIDDYSEYVSRVFRCKSAVTRFEI